MFERFSAGYYLGRLYVQPYEGDRAAMDRAQHRRAVDQLYADEASITSSETPLVMKIDRTHLAVHGADPVPADTLAIPMSTFDSLDINNPPSLREVLLAEADRARDLLAIARPEQFAPDRDRDRSRAR